MSSEPPDEPQQRSEPNTLSPASPKPIHFPAPAHIPVLEMQMDVGFNQTEAHMSDPAMHNTELRADCWRDPGEQDGAQTQNDQAMQDSSSRVSDVKASGAEIDTHGDGDAQQREHSHANQTFTNGEPAQSSSTSHITSHGNPSASHIDSSANANVINTVEPIATSASHPHDTAGLASSSARDGSVVVQSLLDTLQTTPSTIFNTAPASESMTIATTVSPSAQTPQALSTSASSPVPTSALAVPSSGLPPRPPPQEQPLIHPNFAHSQHIRDYHPHVANAGYPSHGRANSQGNAVEGSSRDHVPPVQSPAAGGTDAAHGGGQPYPANPSAASHTFTAPPDFQTLQQYAQASATVDTRHDGARPGGQYARPEDRPWTAEIQRKYDRFLDEERKYVSEGRWEQFPQGSRLFVGNLSSERVTKRDIFHVFHIYGELAQISIKQAYGFVQFIRAEDCAKALEMEQGTAIRDKKIHLEISKPQKSRNQPARARSRSPDHGRGKGSNVDRYVSGQRGGHGRSGSGGGNGFRGGNMRSPTPPRGYRDRYDDRYRRSRSRSRSRSPHYRKGGSVGRYRSPSPRRDNDDDLPLPKRDPRDVPDVQILVLDQLERDFIAWVEQAFSSRSVKADVLLLSPRLSEQAVIRRQIVEGVIAVCKLTRQNQQSGKIGLQVFNRRGGANNVSFEEYDNLDPPICAELVIRAKQTQQAPAPQYGGNPSAYGGTQYSGAPPQQAYMYGNQQPSQQAPYGHQGYPPTQPAQGAAAVPPNLQHLITTLDPASLQTLISAINPQSANPYGAPAASQPPSLAALQNNPAIANYLRQQQQQQQQQQAPLPPQQQQGAPPTGTGQSVNMQDILARLGTYKQ